MSPPPGAALWGQLPSGWGHGLSWKTWVGQWHPELELWVGAPYVGPQLKGWWGRGSVRSLVPRPRSMHGHPGALRHVEPGSHPPKILGSSSGNLTAFRAILALTSSSGGDVPQAGPHPRAAGLAGLDAAWEPAFLRTPGSLHPPAPPPPGRRRCRRQETGGSGPAGWVGLGAAVRAEGAAVLPL